MQRLDKIPLISPEWHSKLELILYTLACFLVQYIYPRILYLIVSKKHMKQNSQYIMCNETLLPIFLPLSLTSWRFFTNPFEKKYVRQIGSFPQKSRWKIPTKSLVRHHQLYPAILHHLSPPLKIAEIRRLVKSTLPHKNASWPHPQKGFTFSNKATQLASGMKEKNPLLPSEIPCSALWGPWNSKVSNFIPGWWLNQPIWKNMSQHGFIFPNFRGENSKNVWNHHLDSSY